MERDLAPYQVGGKAKIFTAYQNLSKVAGGFVADMTLLLVTIKAVVMFSYSEGSILPALSTMGTSYHTVSIVKSLR